MGNLRKVKPLDAEAVIEANSLARQMIETARRLDQMVSGRDQLNKNINELKAEYGILYNRRAELLSIDPYCPFY